MPARPDAVVRVAAVLHGGAGVRHGPGAPVSCHVGLRADSSESALWNNLYIAIAKAPLVPWDKIEPRRLAFEAVNDMRYVPASALYEARSRGSAVGVPANTQATSSSTARISARTRPPARWWT